MDTITIVKTIVHKSPNEDTIFLFTSIISPFSMDGTDRVAFQVKCPAGKGEAWVKDNIGDGYDVTGTNMYVPFSSEEIIAPSIKG